MTTPTRNGRPDPDPLDALLDRVVTVKDVGGRDYVLRAPSADAIRDVREFGRLEPDERGPLWAERLFAKCCHHAVNAEASGLRERTEDDWIRVIHAATAKDAGAEDDGGIPKLVAACQRLFGFTVNVTAAENGEVDHAGEEAAGLGDLPS